jgi:hypothetical protein
MRRFIALTLLGGLAVLAGHAVVSLGLHPERLGPVVALLQGCSALVVGTALFGTGMLGLSDGYERMARRADELLGQKALEDAGDDLIVSDHDSLQQINRRFWRGYIRTGIGLGVFMAGLLGLTATLGRTSATLFVVGVSSGIVLLAVVAVTVSVGGLRRLRSAHVGVDTSVRHLSGLPDRRIPDSVRPAHRRPRSRIILFPRRRSIGRGRDRARLSRVRPLGSSG